MSLLVQAGNTSYTIKVRAGSTIPRTYLFGSDHISTRFECNFVLVLRVDPDGDSVLIKAQGPGDEFEVCQLEPGQVFAVELRNLGRVWADNPVADMRVHCTIVPAPV